MNQAEAAAALAGVNQTRNRLAQQSRWPLWRHAAFALAETLIVFAASLPLPWAGAMIALALVLLGAIVHDDRKRYGMFVSGWQKGALPATLATLALVLACLALSVLARDQPAPAPLALAASAIAFIGCTLGSLWWERLYRAQLTTGVAL